MPYYMLAAHTHDSETDAPPDMAEPQQHSWEDVAKLEREMKSAGKWVFSARLHEPTTASVVRASNGEVLTTDGPFAESKDHLGGFYVIEATDLDDAMRWASRVSETIGDAIEVRPFAGVAWEPGG